MTYAWENQDSGPRPHVFDPAPLRPALRSALDGHGVPKVVPRRVEVRRQVVLKALVEDFGGEVTVAALARHLSRKLGATPPALGPGLIDALKALHRFGALALEANGEADFIVRLLPEGANLSD